MGCTNLPNITIPENVTHIGSDAFYWCISLEVIRFLGDAPTVTGTGIFYDVAASYIVVDGDHAASFGGNNATYLGLTVVDASKIATAANLYTQSDYETVVTARDDAIAAQASAEAERDTRPTQAAYDAVVAERNARLTLSEVRDLRLGSSMLEVVDGDASINIELEATDNLGITSPTWTPVPESKVVIHPEFLDGKIKIDVEADDESSSGARFFRFKMAE